MVSVPEAEFQEPGGDFRFAPATPTVRTSSVLGRLCLQAFRAGAWGHSGVRPRGGSICGSRCPSGSARAWERPWAGPQEPQGVHPAAGPRAPWPVRRASCALAPGSARGPLRRVHVAAGAADPWVLPTRSWERPSAGATRGSTRPWAPRTRGSVCSWERLWAPPQGASGGPPGHRAEGFADPWGSCPLVRGRACLQEPQGVHRPRTRGSCLLARGIARGPAWSCKASTQPWGAWEPPTCVLVGVPVGSSTGSCKGSHPTLVLKEPLIRGSCLLACGPVCRRRRVQLAVGGDPDPWVLPARSWEHPWARASTLPRVSVGASGSLPTGTAFCGSC